MTDNEKCQCPIQTIACLLLSHTQQDAERTSCMQMRMTENRSHGDFCQTHPHKPDHKTHIAHKHTDT